MSSAPETDRLAREREFHDELAVGLDPASMPPHPLDALEEEALPFADDSFDVAVGRFVLHHLDLTVAGTQIARVLVPRGTAIFVENSGAAGRRPRSSVTWPTTPSGGWRRRCGSTPSPSSSRPSLERLASRVARTEATPTKPEEIPIR